MNSIKVEKVVISAGHGNKTPETITIIKNHLEKILNDYITDKKKTNKFVLTLCKKPNALFKTKKDKPVGLKLTLRKQKALNILKLLQDKLNLCSNVVYNNSTLFMGVKDHRLLKLERYNYEIPEYGFNVAIVFAPSANRIYVRKLQKCLKKPKLVQSECLETLKLLVS